MKDIQYGNRKAVFIGLAGEKLSRTITGTKEVSAGRSVVAAGSGALLGATATGSVVVAASALGAGALATAAASVVIPVAAVAGAVSLIRSLWD